MGGVGVGLSCVLVGGIENSGWVGAGGGGGQSWMVGGGEGSFAL